jgi:hypothetical protein
MRSQKFLGMSIVCMEDAPGRTTEGIDGAEGDKGEERCNQAWLHKG